MTVMTLLDELKSISFFLINGHTFLESQEQEEKKEEEDEEKVVVVLMEMVVKEKVEMVAVELV